MGRRSDHSREEIREMAVAAAEQILQQEGVNGLSTRKVAKAIGYTVGTLYLTFKNLDDLILHINAKTLDELYQRLLQTTERCANPGANPETTTTKTSLSEQNSKPAACIHALAQAYFRFARDEYARWSLLYEYQNQDEYEIPAWFSVKVEAIFNLIEQQLQAMSLNESADIYGSESGDKSTTKNQQQVSLSAQVLWSSVHGVCVLNLHDKLSTVSDVAVEILIGELISIFLAGYVSKLTKEMR